ncbi:MAG: hypothetical protein VZQ51_05635 [Bacteroidales bacterium]|nr:hypothetical protein [Bacteroidales bacterium]
MKTSFFRILPLTAAVLLATSCSKDENNDNEVVNNNPANVVIEKSVVKIPFSVKVNQGKTLSKIAYSGSESGVTVSFTEDDVTKGTILNVTGTGIEASTLTLEKQGDSYVFTGDIKLISEDDRASFESGDIILTGSFGTVETTIKSSTESLAYLMENCNHQYLATFKSNAPSIDLYDQNSYIEFTVAKGQYKVNIGEGWYPEGEGKIIDQKLNKLWVVLPAGSVSGHFIKANATVDAGKIYTITRTDVVDLGLSVLWCTSNATSTETDQKNWEDAKTLAASVEGYDLPSADNFKELTGETQVKDVTVTKSEKWNGTGTENGVTFSTDYGSVFFPAAGFNGGYNVGYEGNYWSSSPADVANNAYLLYFFDGDAGVLPTYVTFGFSVRLVRAL